MKILLVLESLGFGGVENTFRELIRAVKKQNFDLHFDIYYMNDDPTGTTHYFEEQGAKIYHSKTDRSDLRTHSRLLKEILIENNYDVIQGVSYRFAELIAKLKRMENKLDISFLPKRIVLQSHMAYRFGYSPFKYYVTSRIGKLSLLKNSKYITDFIAVTKAAGKTMFFNSFEVLPNSISFNSFDSKRQFKEDGVLTIGTAGRVTRQKFPMFILAIANYLQKNNPNLKLKVIFAGEGNERHKVTEFAKKNKIDCEITGVRFVYSIHEILNKQFDIFLFPSLFEGFGIALVEAQLALLPSIASKEVPRETDITNLVTFLKARSFFGKPNKNDVKIWADKVLEIQSNPKEYKPSVVENFYYNSESTAQLYNKFYNI